MIRCITGEPIPGDVEQQEAQEQELARLRWENRELRRRVQELDWPGEPDNTASGWRGRALAAEKRIAELLSRIAEIKESFQEHS